MSEDTAHDVKRLIIIIEQLKNQLEKQAEEHRAEITELKKDISDLMLSVANMRSAQPAHPYPYDPTWPNQGRDPNRVYPSDKWWQTYCSSSSGDNATVMMNAEEIKAALGLISDDLK